MEPIRFIIAGAPAGQPRPRGRAMRVKGGKWTAQLYDAKTDQDGRPLPITYWRAAIERQSKPYAPADPWTVAVRVDLVFYFERPQYMLASKWPNGPILHTAKPDRDNLDKPILDVMAWDEERRWGFWRNDSQVCDGRIQKFYAARGCGPGAEVTITLLEEPEPTLTFVEHKRTHIGGFKLAEPKPDGWTAAEQMAADMRGEIEG